MFCCSAICASISANAVSSVGRNIPTGVRSAEAAGCGWDAAALDEAGCGFGDDASWLPQAAKAPDVFPCFLFTIEKGTRQKRDRLCRVSFDV